VLQYVSDVTEINCLPTSTNTELKASVSMTVLHMRGDRLTMGYFDNLDNGPLN
jgi:hypothetical protein